MTKTLPANWYDWPLKKIRAWRAKNPDVESPPKEKVFLYKCDGCTTNVHPEDAFECDGCWRTVCSFCKMNAITMDGPYPPEVLCRPCREKDTTA